MTNRGFIKYVEKRFRKVLHGDVKIEVRKFDVWNERGYNGKWLVNSFKLVIWKGDAIDKRDLGVYCESSDPIYMVEDTLDMICKSVYCREWLKENN